MHILTFEVTIENELTEHDLGFLAGVGTVALEDHLGRVPDVELSQIASEVE